MNHDVLFGAIRAHVHDDDGKPVHWRRLLALLEQVDLTRLNEVVDYVEGVHKRAATPSVARPALEAWRGELLCARVRAYMRLVRVPCPMCWRPCSPPEVQEALERHHEAHIEPAHIILEQLWSQPTWGCVQCHADLTCQACSTHVTFHALTEMLAERLGSLYRANRVALGHLSGREPVIRCQACGPQRKSKGRVTKDEAAAAARYEDRQNHCKVCAKLFVFTAQEQYVWYEKFGIPRGVSCAFPCPDGPCRTCFVDKARCESCQEEVMAHKNIDRALKELPEGSIHQAHVLLHLYHRLGVRPQELNRCRNVLRRAGWTEQEIHTHRRHTPK